MNTKFDVIVIGAGPAGYVAAIRCAQLGMSVACVDEWQNPGGESAPGGTCLNAGCIPSKALLESSDLFAQAQTGFKNHGIEVGEPRIDIPAMMARKDKVVHELTQGISGLFKANRVEFVHGHATLSPGKRVNVIERHGKKILHTLDADNIIIAAGSSSVKLDQAPLQQDYIVDPGGALTFESVPASLGIIGAGAIGLEIGSIWSRLGSDVVMIEAMDEFLSIVDKQISRAAFRSLKKQGLDIRINARLISTEIKRNKVHVTYEDNRGAQQVAFDRLVVSVGRKPNSDYLFGDEMELEIDERCYIHVNDYCETSVPGIYAIGDVVRGPMLAHKGSQEGIMVAERIAGGTTSVNYSLVPAVIYTQPEIAWVGKTEQECEALGIAVNTGVFPMSASGRARSISATDGMVKIIADRETDRVLGVHIFSTQASELISQAVTAMEMQASAEDIALTMFAHPTLAEAMHEAAQAVHKQAIHIKN